MVEMGDGKGEGKFSKLQCTAHVNLEHVRAMGDK
jgi:hypothetical protein